MLACSDGSKTRPRAPITAKTRSNPPQPYDRGSSIFGPGPYAEFAVDGIPYQKPPWGRLVAVNAKTGEIAWQSVLGSFDRLPPGKQHTGNVGSSGPIVTAGGLVFAASNDRRLHAFDSRTGRELWQDTLDRNIIATPMTYAAAGAQYVAVVATDTVVAYSLPRSPGR